MNSDQLSAFHEVSRLKSFTLAAEKLFVTQSALSQRISKLEKELDVTLFIRSPEGIELTESGYQLLRYCEQQNQLESEVLSNLQVGSNQLAGIIRIASFSSIMRSVIIPSLSTFLRNNKSVTCEFQTYEVVDLFDVLKSGKADLVILDYHLNKSGVVEHVIGKEEYVLIESIKHTDSPDVYLDHGPSDNATESFFLFQGEKNKKIRRTFMGDVYGIIDGVESGLGKAVMSRHLVEENSKIKILKSSKKYFRDVTLNYFEQPYYSKLQNMIVNEIIEKSKKVF